MSVRAAIAVALAFSSCLAAVACAGGSTRGSAAPRERLLVARAPDVAALAALEGGGLRFGERRSGIVLQADARGRVRGAPIARVAVSSAGQRGLLGLAVDRRGATFAAWTRPDRRLVVGRLAPGRPRLVWRGPPTSTLANGGHLAFAPDGRLVIGIGDLQDPARTRDPRAPNGKLLSLDPSGPPSQEPRVLSSGWNNPFAFAFTRGGALWVADNSPGRRPERLARGDRGRPMSVTDLPRKTAPSGLAAVSDRELAVCGVVSGRLDLYALDGSGRARSRPRTLAADCRLGVVRLAGGRLAYSTGAAIRVLRP